MPLHEDNSLVSCITLLLAIRTHLTFLNNQSTLLCRFLEIYTTSPDRSAAKGKASRRALIVIENTLDRLEVFQDDLNDDKQLGWCEWPTWASGLKIEVAGLQSGIRELRESIDAYLKFVVED